MRAWEGRGGLGCGKGRISKCVVKGKRRVSGKKEKFTKRGTDILCVTCVQCGRPRWYM